MLVSRYDAACLQGQPILVHGNRALKDKTDTSYNHLYTFFSKIHLGNWQPRCQLVIDEP